MRPSRGERGQATVEYVLLLAFVLGISIGVLRAITAGFDRGVLIFGGALEKGLKTGRLSAKVWYEEK